jgi:outer membrane receptor for ferrienterochelin and colicins
MRVVKCVPLVVILAVVMGLPSTASAQEPAPRTSPMSLEDLMRVQIEPVFGASKRLQPVTEAPASVSIITADDIARYGYRTLADVLRGVRGFYVTYDRNYSYTGVRGFALPGDYNTRILMLVDGHRMNDDVYEQATPGAEFGLDPSTFARVEIIRGPASSLYGTSAFFAVVNIITKTGAAINGVNVSVDGGSFGTRRGRILAGRKLANGLDFAVSGAFTQADGPARLYFPEFDAPDTNQGVARRLDGEQVRQLFGRLTYGHLTVSGAFGHRTKDVPTAAFDTVFGDPRFRTTDEHEFLDAQYERSTGATRVSVRSYLDRYQYDGTYPQQGFDGSPVVLYDDYANGLWAGVEGRVTRPVAARQTMTLGAEFRDNIRQNQGITYVDDPASSFLIERASHVIAGYAQDEIKLSTRFLVNAGVRFDAYDGFSRLAPRIGVIFKASSSQAIKYLYGNAFRAPNAYELDYSLEGARHSSLRPETIDTHEVVWERYVGRSLRTSVSAYVNDVQRLILATSGSGADLTYVNRGHVNAAGIELEGEVRLAAGLRAEASYVLQRAKDADSGQVLVDSPRHTAKVRLSVPGPLGLTTSTELQIMSARRTLANQEVPGVALTNVTWRVPLRRGFFLSSTLKNLFDRTYADPGSEEHREDAIVQDGRTFRIGIDWNFGMK